MSQATSSHTASEKTPRSSRPRQLELFPLPVPKNWQRLSTEAVELDEGKYLLIRQCYDEVYNSFLPGPGVTPFFTQVAQLLQARGMACDARQVIRLVKQARKEGIEDFPDVRRRSIPSSSSAARSLREPAAPVRMSPEEYSVFARVYRDLVREGYARKEKGKGTGFYAEAESRMRKQGFEYSRENLRNFASYRRRLGDINFPRLRGSQNLERLHVAAVDRIQALGVMATGLMHEILQPLQIIRGAADLEKHDLAEATSNPSKSVERMGQIIQQAEKLSSVVQHVRTIARAGEPQLGPVSLRTVVENAVSLFLNQLRGKGIQVDVDSVSPELSPIHADAIATERIFINLLTNARDAIEETGRGEGAIRISAHTEREFVICEVTDNGLGIAEENQPRIFDPYFTTKEVGKGTGMGLTEVMNLMIQFGGRVSVQSIPRQSTTFRLEFPRYVGPE
jgi:signal transduction histidine kinase